MAAWPVRALAALTLLVPIALAGCGSDEPDATDGSTTAAPSTTVASPIAAGDEAFCDAHLALATALSGPQSGEADVEALTATLSATAPERLSDAVDTFISVGSEAAAAQDDSVFVSDAFRDPARQIDEDVAAHCGHQVVEVSAVDYGFGGVPAELAAGPTMLHVVNDGADIHEAYLFRRADGVEGDPVDLVNADPGNDTGDLEEVGVAYVGPAGDEAYLTTDLGPGAYVLVCFFPQGVTSMDDLASAGDAPDHDHRSAGMVVGFEVA